ncbi:MAG TPA: kinase/pyrophosphorylase, partial [candidate division Zixibacteria bacterium]|nr:kinase/pyrophosphorylase [candidate division Zixibacteria bacterium]
SQYAQAEVGFRLEGTFQNVRNRKAVDKVLAEISNEYLVIYSFISPDIHKYFHRRLAERDILHINVLDPMLKTMRKFLGVHPDYRPGILHRIDDRYYKKVDAIGFTVEHDDGRGAMIGDADLVLVGLSRTCKTPISMYLACNHGLKVANIPIVPGVTTELALKHHLGHLPRERIVGLLMDPDILSHVREERLELLARTDSAVAELSDYVDVRVIRRDYRWCRELFERNGWRTVDVTRRAIEEVAVEILDELGIPREE